MQDVSLRTNVSALAYNESLSFAENHFNLLAAIYATWEFWMEEAMTPKGGAAFDLFGPISRFYFSLDEKLLKRLGYRREEQDLLEVWRQATRLFHWEYASLAEFLQSLEGEALNTHPAAAFLRQKGAPTDEWLQASYGAFALIVAAQRTGS